MTQLIMTQLLMTQLLVTQLLMTQLLMTHDAQLFRALLLLSYRASMVKVWEA